MTDAAVAARPHRIFLSYAFQDRNEAERVRRVLSRDAGARVFTDDMLAVGEGWSDRLRREIAECDAFVLVVGPRTFASDSVLQEIGGAWALHKPFVVILAEGGEARLPVDVAEIQTMRLDELERKGANRLLAQIPLRGR